MGRFQKDFIPSAECINQGQARLLKVLSSDFWGWVPSNYICVSLSTALTKN